MFVVSYKSNGWTARALRVLSVVALVAMLPSLSLAAKKKPVKGDVAPVEAAKPKFTSLDQLDYSKIIWPAPPAPMRLKYINYFSSQPLEKVETKKQAKKSSWMERMAAGDAPVDAENHKTVFILDNPYGMVVDSKGTLYVADGKVGAIFMFNTETKDCELIKSGTDGMRFGLVTGLAIDDDDTLFASDAILHRVVVYDAKHHVIATFNDGMAEPTGMALDTENRQLYVVDTKLDVVLVYDADTYKLIRKMGTPGKEHRLTSVGNFAMPTNAAVDRDGNLYVTDTWNDRVEIFDADGKFIRTFGKNGDGPGRFARPKGIAIDADGHIWVADAVQDALQVFTPEGHVLMRVGTHGMLPGQFSSVGGLYIDRQNRVFTADQYPGRVQMFRYFTDAEAKAQLEKINAEQLAKAKEREEARQKQKQDPQAAPEAKAADAGK